MCQYFSKLQAYVDTVALFLEKTVENLNTYVKDVF